MEVMYQEGSSGVIYKTSLTQQNNKPYGCIATNKTTLFQIHNKLAGVISTHPHTRMYCLFHHCDN